MEQFITAVVAASATPKPIATSSITSAPSALPSVSTLSAYEQANDAIAAISAINSTLANLLALTGIAVAVIGLVLTLFGAWAYHNAVKGAAKTAADKVAEDSATLVQTKVDEMGQTFAKRMKQREEEITAEAAAGFGLVLAELDAQRKSLREEYDRRFRELEDQHRARLAALSEHLNVDDRAAVRESLSASASTSAQEPPRATIEPDGEKPQAVTHVDEPRSAGTQRDGLSEYVRMQASLDALAKAHGLSKAVMPDPGMLKFVAQITESMRFAQKMKEDAGFADNIRRIAGLPTLYKSFPSPPSPTQPDGLSEGESTTCEDNESRDDHGPQP